MWQIFHIFANDNDIRHKSYAFKTQFFNDNYSEKSLESMVRSVIKAVIHIYYGFSYPMSLKMNTIFSVGWVQDWKITPKWFQIYQKTETNWRKINKILFKLNFYD